MTLLLFALVGGGGFVLGFELAYRWMEEVLKVDYTIKDSGETRTFETGAVRDSGKGKGRYDLIPPETEAALALHFGHGAEKKGDRNWEKGMPLGCYLDSARRHLNKWQRGERDENHLIAAVWNLVCLYATAERVKAGRLPRSLDDNGYLDADLGPAVDAEQDAEDRAADCCSDPNCALKRSTDPEDAYPAEGCVGDPDAPAPEEVQRRNQLEEAVEAARYLLKDGPVTMDAFRVCMGKRGFLGGLQDEALAGLKAKAWHRAEGGCFGFYFGLSHQVHEDAKGVIDA